MVLSPSNAASALASAEAATFWVALVMSVVNNLSEPVSLRLVWSTAGAREKWCKGEVVGKLKSDMLVIIWLMTIWRIKIVKDLMPSVKPSNRTTGR